METRESPGAARRGDAHSFPVLLVQCQMDADHFAGLDRALVERGIVSGRVFPDQPPPEMGAATRAVVISDTFAGMNALASRQARRVGATVVLVMDGIVEYRNTFVNPRVGAGFVEGERAGARFLRPAPADVVACCGEIDRRVLEALGNRAVATGLPRLAGVRAVAASPDRRAVLVATANQPWFTAQERNRLAGSLADLRDELARRGVEAVWRLRGDLDAELGVTSDRRALREVLAEVPAVLTTPSTLLVESMLAGRATGVLHVHPTPLWQAAAWGWRGTGGGELDVSAMHELAPGARRELVRVHEEAAALTAWFDDAGALVESLLAREAGMMARQGECLARLEASGAPGAAAAKLAGMLQCAVAGDLRARPDAPGFASPVRIPSRRATGSRPCVVSCVACSDTPVGGVLTWSERLGEAFARRDLGYDVRTLVICVNPDLWRQAGVRVECGERTDLCVIDALADHTQSLGQVREAIERLAGGVPALVIPNYTDITYAAAMQLRARGSRTLAIAHTDEEYYRRLIGTYHLWDAGVGVSGACVEWLTALEARTRGTAARAVHSIHYGVPTAAAPRVVEPTGPLKIAYVGRMVQPQKRIADLLGVIDGLEGRGVGYELHLVGDGVDLAGWRAELARRELRSGRVVCHGRQEAAWVERFMRGIDVSVLVSEYEGTSISMLEAMGAGVVPAVTAVRSGAGEWVVDGKTGVTAPVGEPDAMAERLAELARDRGLLARLGRGAWERARGEASVERMAERYKAVFDAALARPAERGPTDLGLRLIEKWRWCKDWAEEPERALGAIRERLVEAGYRRIALDHPEPGCDAVIVRTDVRPITRLQAEQIPLWRECGLGVVTAPHLRSDRPEDALSANGRTCELLRGALRGAASAGLGRIAIYGTGKHTRRAAALFDGTLPLVGFIDDAPPAWEYMFGLPVVAAGRALEVLRPDAVVLSSDAWEGRMWERTAAWRRAGVRVIPVYGTYADEGAEGAGRPEKAVAA